MFNKKSSVDEIMQSMQHQLVDGAINKMAETQAQLVKAADFLNAAAEIFDETGLSVQAEVVTAVLESLAAKKKSKKKKTKAKVKPKAPSSEKMVENLKEKGWVFDESGAKDQNHADDNCADVNCAVHNDMSYINDEEAELYRMLEHFTSNLDGNDASDDDFEDEENEFGARMHDPFNDTKRTYLDREDDGVSYNDPFGGYDKKYL